MTAADFFRGGTQAMNAVEFLERWGGTQTITENEILKRWEEHAKECERVFKFSKWENEATGKTEIFYRTHCQKIYGKGEEYYRKYNPLRELDEIREEMGALYIKADNAAEVKYFKGCLNLLREMESKHKELFCEFFENLGFTKTAPDCYELPK